MAAEMLFMWHGSVLAQENDNCYGDAETYLSCMVEQGMLATDVEEKIFSIFKVPHHLKTEQGSYFVESKILSFSVLNKTSLMAQPMWLSGDTRRNKQCLSGSDVFIYFASNEDLMHTKAFYLWNEYKMVFLSQHLMEIPSEETLDPPLAVKLLHIRHCYPQP